MAAIIKHTKEDVLKFEADVCTKCRCLESCKVTFPDITEHISGCPKFFNYMIGYKSFIDGQIEWMREHPEEVEAKRQRNLELSRQIKSQRRTKKKNQG